MSDNTKEFNYWKDKYKKAFDLLIFWEKKYQNLIAQIPENATAKNGDNLREWAREQVK